MGFQSWIAVRKTKKNTRAPRKIVREIRTSHTNDTRNRDTLGHAEWWITRLRKGILLDLPQLHLIKLGHLGWLSGGACIIWARGKKSHRFSEFGRGYPSSWSCCQTHKYFHSNVIWSGQRKEIRSSDPSIIKDIIRKMQKLGSSWSLHPKSSYIISL